MNKMIGIILIIIGVVVFVVGVIVYNSSTKQNEWKDKSPEINEMGIPSSEINKQKENRNELDEEINKSSELDKVVEMAIADGILTENERKIIKKIATEQEMDYNEIIKNAEKKLSESKFESETELIDYNKKKGDDFEKFIVQKFNKKYFRIKEWAGDKYVKGIYAETTPQPDLLLEFNLNQNKYPFAVECKWRQNFYKGGIEFAKKDQFNRYKNYEETKNIPVFIAIGIGGKAASPENIFIVPLRSIETNFIKIKELKKYEKDSDKYFYYDIKTKELK
jgi:cell division protein FtsL